MPHPSGQSLSEYGLILGLVVILSIPVVMTLGAQSTANLNSVSANSTQLDRLSGLLGNPTLATPAVSPGGSVSNGGGTETGVAGIFRGRTLTVAGQALAVSRDASGLVQLKLNGAESNNGNVLSADGGTVTRLLAQQLNDLADQPDPSMPNAAPSNLIRHLSSLFLSAATIQSDFD
jgi:hypothetical protein